VNSVGILISPSGTNQLVAATLNRVESRNNLEIGLDVSGESASGGTIDVSVVDSVLASNSLGIDIGTFVVTEPKTQISLLHSAISNNGTGIQATGPQSTIRLSETLITGNQTGWTQSNGSLVQSYGNNFIDGNVNINLPPPLIAVK
jgi:hypothetical protein